jgi:hypothetical protein
MTVPPVRDMALGYVVGDGRLHCTWGKAAYMQVAGADTKV